MIISPYDAVFLLWLILSFFSFEQARIPREAKRILQCKPGTRSSKELHYVSQIIWIYFEIVYVRLLTQNCLETNYNS